MTSKKNIKAIRQTHKSMDHEQICSLVDNLPCAVFRQSIQAGEWCFTYLGNEFTAISGYPASDYIDKPTSLLRSLINLGDVESIEQKISQCVTKHRPYKLEYRINTSNGHERWLYETGKPEINQAGKVVHLNGFILDISERKQSETLREQVEAVLIKHQDMHRQAEKIGQLGYWEWDEVNDRLLSCSDQLSLIYEMIREEILSEFSSLDDELKWIHPQDRERYRQTTAEADEKLDGVDIEFRILTKSGSVRHVRELSELVVDDEGKRLRSFGTMQDITEQKQAEERLHFQMDLQKLVSELPTKFSAATALDSSINQSLLDLGEMTESDRVSLWQFTEDRTAASKTHEWCAKGVESQLDKFQNVPLSRLQGLGVYEQIVSGKSFYIADIYQLPPAGHVIRKFFDEIGIKSVVVLPILDEGEVIWFFTLNNPLRLNALNNPDISMLKIFGDNLFIAIQRARAQTALVAAKEAAERSADIVNKTLLNIGQSVVMVDADGKLLVYHDIFLDDIHINEEAAAKFETFEEAIRVRYPDDEEGFQRSMELARAGKKIVFEINTPNGKVIQARHTPLEDGGFVRVYTDISELKKIQNDLVVAKELAERSSDIANKTLHNIGQAIVMVDGNGDLLVYNDIFLDDINVSPEQAADIKTFEEVIRLRYPDDEEGFERSMELARSGKKAVYEASTPTGRIIEIRHNPLDDGGFVRTYTDISELKSIQNDLQIAKEIAEQANQAKANYLAAMSHEIRTPMTGVIGMVDLLKQTNLGSEQRHMVQTIAESGQTLLTVINDILDFSKIEAGKLEIEFIPFPLLDLVEVSAQTVATSAVNRDLRLITYIEPELPQFVIGDPVRIRQILTNLCNNAIKFSDSGEIVLRVERFGEVTDDKVNVCFSVTDQGIGISEEVQSNLFQSFFQAEASTTRKFGGSGLGLEISKRLTDLMAGEISVESVLGEGSTFSVKLVFECSDEKENIYKVVDLSGLNLLLVVSNPTEQFIYRKYLQHWRANVDLAPDIDRCFEQCVSAFDTDAPYDIVILGPQWNRDKQSDIREKIISDGRLSELKFVYLLKGRRRRARTDTSDIASVDVDPLRRNDFLEVVAIAAGKASPEVFYKENDEGLFMPVIAPSIDEARERGSLILVAEDNRINRDVIGQQLDLLGYAYEIVDDGKQALDAWLKNDYGLLLTDCHMPNLDGFELTEAIREHESESVNRIPIVAITANTLLGEADRCLAVGMDDYLAKPVVMKDLKEALEKWMPTTSNFVENIDNTNKTLAEDKVLITWQTSKAPIDQDVLRGMLGDDEEMINVMLQDFLEPLQESFHEIQSCVEKKNARELEMAAHKLKSSALVIGANEMADIAQILETAGKKDDWRSVTKESAKLVRSMEEIRRYIKSL